MNKAIVYKILESLIITAIVIATICWIYYISNEEVSSFDKEYSQSSDDIDMEVNAQNSQHFPY